MTCKLSLYDVQYILRYIEDGSPDKRVDITSLHQMLHSLYESMRIARQKFFYIYGSDAL